MGSTPTKALHSAANDNDPENLLALLERGVAPTLRVSAMSAPPTLGMLYHMLLLLFARNGL